MADGGWYETRFRLSFNSVSLLTQSGPFHLCGHQLFFENLPYARHPFKYREMIVSKTNSLLSWSLQSSREQK